MDYPKFIVSVNQKEESISIQRVKHNQFYCLSLELLTALFFSFFKYLMFEILTLCMLGISHVFLFSVEKSRSIAKTVCKGYEQMTNLAIT